MSLQVASASTSKFAAKKVSADALRTHQKMIGKQKKEEEEARCGEREGER